MCVICVLQIWKSSVWGFQQQLVNTVQIWKQIRLTLSIRNILSLPSTCFLCTPCVFLWCRYTKWWRQVQRSNCAFYSFQIHLVLFNTIFKAVPSHVPASRHFPLPHLFFLTQLTQPDWHASLLMLSVLQGPARCWMQLLLPGSPLPDSVLRNAYSSFKHDLQCHVLSGVVSDSYRQLHKILWSS